MNRDPLSQALDEADAEDALEIEIACEVRSASTARGYLTYEYGGKTYRVDLTLTEETS